ncbi:hypothetical protein QTP88_017520 [Uroleucon formosanum]
MYYVVPKTFVLKKLKHYDTLPSSLFPGVCEGSKESYVHQVGSIGRPSGGLGRIRAGENDATLTREQRASASTVAAATVRLTGPDPPPARVRSSAVRCDVPRTVSLTSSGSACRVSQERCLYHIGRCASTSTRSPQWHTRATTHTNAYA